VFLGEEVAAYNLQGLSCEELSTLEGRDGEVRAKLTLCDIVDALCADNSNPCDVCPFGIANPDIIVSDPGKQPVITCARAISDIQETYTRKDRCLEIQEGAAAGGCCKPDPNFEGEACNLGPDGKPYPDLEKVPSISEDNVFLGEEVAAYNLQGLSCEELSTLEGRDGEVRAKLTLCDIVDALCADNSNPCDVCPFGIANPDIIVSDPGKQPVITCTQAILDVQELYLSKDRCLEIQNGAASAGCCKPDPDFVACTPCFKDGKGFDRSLTFQNPIFPFFDDTCEARLLQRYSETDTMCLDVQATSYLYCGCETAPPELCLTDERGVPIEFVDNVARNTAYLAALYFIYEYPQTVNPDEDFTQELCVEPCNLCADGSSFDKSISIEGNPLFVEWPSQPPPETCGDLEYILPFVKEAECDFFQFVGSAFCGCPSHTPTDAPVVAETKSPVVPPTAAPAVPPTDAPVVVGPEEDNENDKEVPSKTGKKGKNQKGGKNKYDSFYGKKRDLGNIIGKHIQDRKRVLKGFRANS